MDKAEWETSLLEAVMASMISISTSTTEVQLYKAEDWSIKRLTNASMLVD